MPSDRTVLEHLLDGRDALVQEVKRLTTAIEELDSVIARIGGAGRPAEPVTPPVTTVQSATPEPNSRAEVEPVNSTPAQPPVKATSTRPRKAPAKRQPARPAARTERAPQSGSGQKSIRVHVLEMLAAEDRDFGLAEIIDKIHAEGIQAHDDAVRSITIKLMKDGRVERVGRGQYRLARRGSSASSAPARAATPEPSASDVGYVPPLDLGQSWQRPGT